MKNSIQGTADMEMRTLRHDLRAPIANVIALTQMSMSALASGGAKENILPYLSNILAAAQELEQMTGEAAQSEEESFTALELAQALSATTGAMAQEKHQLLRIDVSGLGGGALSGRKTTLKRVLTNLLTNAVKYTPQGGKVLLTARMRGREAEFVVEDNGMGMKPEFMERMFEPFARAPEVEEEEIAGCGLGLSIVQRLTQEMGGRLAVRSEWGKGTAITLMVPVEPVREAEGTLRERHFLLAEDNDLSAQIAAEILGAQGALVQRAADGAQAVGLFLSAPEGTFDAVLMDMHMPRMDGCAAARAIRESARGDARRIPILALTAGGDALDERDALAAGMNGCMEKPLHPEKLRQALKYADS